MIFHFNDTINGLFETSGAIVLFLNILKLLKDKKVRGVYWPVTLFFAIWGIWNLYYYPSLSQWLSFSGGILIVTMNLWWVFLALMYRKN